MISIVFCLVGWTLGWMIFGRPKSVTQLRSAAGSVKQPASRNGFDVIIPARNEAASIGLLLSDIASLPQSGNRVLIINDHSTDSTVEIASGFAGVEVIDAPDLPEGWTGKSWACHIGFEYLRTTTDDHDRGLVFFDADVRVDPDVVQLLVDHQSATGALVSVQPWHQTKRPYEKLSALFNVIALVGTAMSSPTKSTGAFGPVLVTTPAAYLRAGGHEAVKDQIVEDLALAANYRQSAQRVELFRGANQVRFRMYPNGLRQLCEGWAKNFATGAGSTNPVRLLAAVLWITSLGSATALLIEAAMSQHTVWIALVVYAAFAAQLAWMFRQVGNFGPMTALVFPILVAFFFCIFAWSIWKTYFRQSVTWRGRKISVGARSQKPC